MNLILQQPMKEGFIPRPCALFQLLKEKPKLPKELLLMTYTFSARVADVLNKLADMGVKIKVITGRDHEIFKPRFEVRECANHIKLWLIDGVAYVGSTNLVDDTIPNIMVKQNKAVSKELKILFLNFYNNHEPGTIFL